MCLSEPEVNPLKMVGGLAAAAPTQSCQLDASYNEREALTGRGDCQVAQLTDVPLKTIRS
jgi:hypothetical protein